MERNEPTTAEYTPDELIGAVRWCWVNHETSGCYGCPLEHKPCDGLEEALANCVERLNRENVDLCIDCGEMTITIEQLERDNAALTARAENAEAERDAELSKAVRAVLIEIMGRLASFENYFPPCNFCEYENGERVECKQCYENGNFKYRGCAKVKQNKEVEE